MLQSNRILAWGSAVLGACLLLGCATRPPGDPLAAAQRLAQGSLLLDTHIDAPLFILREQRDIGVDTTGQFDFPKARAGGLDLAFMSIFVPASVDETRDAKAFAEGLIDLVEDAVGRAPERFQLVGSTAEVKRGLRSPRVMLALGMENGSALQGQLDNLAYFHQRGIRYITLTHSRSNAICDSSYDEKRPWGGLSAFGRRLIPAMNDQGMLIDVSHISDQALDQVLTLSRTPVVATHSSARHFTPGFERNLSDEQLQAIARRGGVVQVNFGSGFVNETSRLDGNERDRRIRELVQQRGLPPDSEAARQAGRDFAARWPYKRARLEDVLDHIDHIRQVAGIDHVGFGSDFDGVGDTLPEGLEDVSHYPRLIAGLLQRGYKPAEVRKIMGGNFMRVWREVERQARP